MINVKEESLGEAWRSYLREVLNTGVRVPDDREAIMESCSALVEMDIVSDDDKLLKQYGDPHVAAVYRQKMFSREIIPELNSTYGDRLFDQDGVDQVEWITNRLKSKWWTKGANISLLKPNDPGPRIPCLTNIQAVIRDNRVNLTAIFRSQNVYNSYGNFLGLHDIQSLISSKLGLEVGCLSAFVVCPHIYESDLSRARMIVESETATSMTCGEPAKCCSCE